MINRFRVLACCLALALAGGCSPAQIYGQANQEALLLWGSYQGYRNEQWDRRRELRQDCTEKVIDPGVDQLVALGRYEDAIKVYTANYPGLVLLDIFDDVQRGELAEVLKDMPACEWPEDVVLDDPSATAAPTNLGPFMLVPAVP